MLSMEHSNHRTSGTRKTEHETCWTRNMLNTTHAEHGTCGTRNMRNTEHVENGTCGTQNMRNTEHTEHGTRGTRNMSNTEHAGHGTQGTLNMRNTTHAKHGTCGTRNMRNTEHAEQGTCGTRHTRNTEHSEHGTCGTWNRPNTEHAEHGTCGTRNMWNTEHAEHILVSVFRGLFCPPCPLYWNPAHADHSMSTNIQHKAVGSSQFSVLVMFSKFLSISVNRIRRFWGGNSTTAWEVSRFQCLFPNPNWLVWKGIQAPKTRSNNPWADDWLMGIFPLVVELGLVQFRQRFGCLPRSKRPIQA